MNANGTPVMVNGSKFEVGTIVEVANVKMEVCNTMPSLGLIGFVKLNRLGRRLCAPESMSIENVEKFMKIGAIVVLDK